MKGCREKQDGIWPREGGIMRMRVVPFTVALLLLVTAGCSSSDPTASDE